MTDSNEAPVTHNFKMLHRISEAARYATLAASTTTQAENTYAAPPEYYVKNALKGIAHELERAVGMELRMPTSLTMSLSSFAVLALRLASVCATMGADMLENPREQTKTVEYSKMRLQTIIDAAAEPTTTSLGEGA